MAKRSTKSAPVEETPKKYYSREEAIADGQIPTKLFGINEAIVAGQATNLPLYSARERALAASFAKSQAKEETK